LAKKTLELSQREEAVKIREEKVQHFMKIEPMKNRIQLQVGSVTYHTTASILLSVKDSYFHGLLNPKFREDDAGLFIPRDGEVFRYVLEYLTYGKLCSQIEDEGVLAKLSIDSDFYMLPELHKQISEIQKPEKTVDPIWMQVGQAGAWGNGSFIAWNQPKVVPATHFGHAGDTITIKRAGLYHVFIRYEFTCSTNGKGSANVDLYVNSAVVARLYHGENHGYHDGRTLEHLQPFNDGDTIRVKYHSNSNGGQNGDALATSLTILCLSSR